MNRRALACLIAMFAVACSSDEEGSSGTGGSAGTAGSSGSGGGAGTSGSGGSTGGSAGTAGSSADAGEDATIDAGPPATCAEACVAVVAAQCVNFMVTQEECEPLCDGMKTGPCATEFEALLQCMGPTPQIACNAAGEPTFAGCFDQEVAFDTCNEPNPGDGG